MVFFSFNYNPCIQITVFIGFYSIKKPSRNLKTLHFLGSGKLEEKAKNKHDTSIINLHVTDLEDPHNTDVI